MNPITLRAARRMKDVTMEEMAKLLGIDRSCYGKWEKDAKSIGVQDARKICQRLGFQLDDIVEFKSNHIT